MLTGYYDLKRCPPTYDVVTFLVSLERERIRRGEKTVAIEILPGPVDGFRQDTVWPRSSEERRKLFNKIVLPMCQMLPCERITVHTTRPKGPVPNSWGFDQYSMEFSNFVTAMRDEIRPLRPARENQTLSLITITLRESEHWPARNSNVPEWRKAGEELQARGYRVVVVRDTAHADEPLGDLPIDPVASRDLAARASLYRSAHCNLFINNGPAWMAFALDAPLILFRPATEGVGRLYGADGLAAFGLRKGHQMPFSPSWQRIVWEDDRADVIVPHVQAFEPNRAAA